MYLDRVCRHVLLFCYTEFVYFEQLGAKLLTIGVILAVTTHVYYHNYDQIDGVLYHIFFNNVIGFR